MAHEEKSSRDIMVAQSGYNFYSDVVSSSDQNQTQFISHLPPPQQSFEPTTTTAAAAEIYNLTAGMEMIGFPPKHTENPAFWKGFFSTTTAAAAAAKPGDNNGGAGPSSSSSTDNHFYHHHHQNSDNTMTHHQNHLWNNIHHHQHNRFLDGDDVSTVFSCEGNERPSQGLSLSLSSSNPSTIGLQSFQLRQQQQHHQLGHHDHHQLGHVLIRNSKYLVPAQELLNEFCSLQIDEIDHNSSKLKTPKTTESQQSLYSLDLLDLQRRKSKLLQMLDEVDRRYRHYCDQMKAVTTSFESTAGNGAARVYSSLASRAMSRHFRCLRDGIAREIKATKKAMGDKDIAPGTVKGETPRLRLLDQTIRQQRAMQQMSLMESHPWRPQRGLPERSVSVLRAWLFEHFLHPYPSDVDKHILARQTGLSRSQVSNWFINARVRLWKPMVEEMYMEELKEDHEGGSGGGGAANIYENDELQQQMNTHNHSRNEDLKPTHDQLIVRTDSESLSSIVNNNPADKNEAKRSKGAAAPLRNDHNQIISPSFADTYGGSSMELDFLSYGHHPSAGGAAGGGGGVSLTLGLHQNSLFYGGSDNMEDVETSVNNHQYSFLDGENQNLPYRNLMGAQLLRDLAG